MARDVKLAFVVVWLIVSGIAAAAVAAPWLSSPETLLSLSARCQSASHTGACALCGMSRAFVAISEGNWSEARTLNSASPWLFSAFALNAIWAAIWCSWKGFLWKFSA